MQTEPPQIDISHVLDAPRELAYRAFTEPDHFMAWWGPIGSSLPPEEIEFDVRPGGHQRWTEISTADPGVRVHVSVDLTDVTDGELLDGVMHLTGQLPDGLEPFDTRVRVEFYDETGGRTRLRIRQWLPTHLTGSAEQGWLEALTKLDATVISTKTSPSNLGAS